MADDRKTKLVNTQRPHRFKCDIVYYTPRGWLVVGCALALAGLLLLAVILLIVLLAR